MFCSPEQSVAFVFVVNTHCFLKDQFSKTISQYVSIKNTVVIQVDSIVENFLFFVHFHSVFRILFSCIILNNTFV